MQFSKKWFVTFWEDEAWGIFSLGLDFTAREKGCNGLYVATVWAMPISAELFMWAFYD